MHYRRSSCQARCHRSRIRHSTKWSLAFSSSPCSGSASHTLVFSGHAFASGIRSRKTIPPWAASWNHPRAHLRLCRSLLHIEQCSPVRGAGSWQPAKRCLCRYRATASSGIRRQVSGSEVYPRFPRLLEEFLQEWRQFLGFLEKEQLGTPNLNQCELTYVNNLEPGVGVEGLRRAGKGNLCLSVRSTTERPRRTLRSSPGREGTPCPAVGEGYTPS